MAALVIAAVIVTIYVTLYFVYNVKQIFAVKNNKNKNKENSLTASFGSGLLLLVCIGATAFIWALI